MRSLVRVGLRPSRNGRLSFGVQLALVFFWILYAAFLIFSDNPTNDRNFLAYTFLTLAVGYLLYILAQNTSIFGSQAYFEITPYYIVQKQGHFRKKIVIPFQEVATMIKNYLKLVKFKVLSLVVGQQQQHPPAA